MTAGLAHLPRLQRVIADALGLERDQVAPGAVLAEPPLNADELDILDIALAAEREFDVVIAKREAEGWRTVADVLATLAGKDCAPGVQG